jgi:hypothetical protein
MRASATAEAGARLAGPVRAGMAAIGERGGMISGANARLAPLFRRNWRVRPQKNAHVSDMGWGRSLNLRIQEIIYGDNLHTPYFYPSKK